MPRPDIGLFFPERPHAQQPLQGQRAHHPPALQGPFQDERAPGVLEASPSGCRRSLTGKMQSAVELRAELMTRAHVQGHCCAREPRPGIQSAWLRQLHGAAEFRIKNGFASHVDFSGTDRQAHPPAGPSSPDFILEFADSPLFLAVSEDKVDVLAKACLGEISLRGDLHMGQILNIALDKIGEYLL
ncbi:MAG: hypothetical protein MZV70_57050 [Desulfobacterales bacterium]|nr:hypothetical protein [Desulfobacterales bacterium]